MHDLPCPASIRTLPLSGGRSLRIAVPDDPEALLDTMTDEEYEKDQLLPYWAEQWPSGRALLTFLSGRAFPATWRLCELGCGLGITGAALAGRGGDTFSVATDIAPDGCRFARHNIMLNGGTPRVVCCGSNR